MRITLLMLFVACAAYGGEPQYGRLEMVQPSTYRSLLRFAWFAALGAGLFIPSIALLGSDKAEPKSASATRDKPLAHQKNRYKVTVFRGVPQKESISKEEKPVFATLVTANKPFDFKVKEGLGASGVLREDKDGKLHFKGQVNFSPTTGVFDLPVELGKGYLNRSGFSSGGLLSFFVVFEQVKKGNANVEGSGPSDADALIFEMRAGKNVQLATMVAPGSDFRVTAMVDGKKWALTGTLHKVVDNVATISASVKYSHEDYSSGREISEQSFRINDLGNSWGTGSWGGIHVHFWIRRGVDPVPTLKSIFARRDNTFWHAAWYATELVRPKAQEAILVDLIDALNDGIDRSGKQPSESIRVIAARTLGNSGAAAKSAAPALVKRLKDENAYVRIAAAIALWKIERHAAAVPALKAEQKSEAEGIKREAEAGLREINSKVNSRKNGSVSLDPFDGGTTNLPKEGLEDPFDDASPNAEPKQLSAVDALSRLLYDKKENVQRASAHELERIARRSDGHLDRVSFNLATYYMKREDWASALRWWRVYSPRTELWPSYKNDCIATCLLRSGKLDEAGETILETAKVARNRIPELVEAYRSQGNLPKFQRHLTGLQARDAEPDRDEKRHEIVKRVAIACEYMEMLRMADRGDVAGLWRKLDMTGWDHIDPPYDFDPHQHAERLLLSIGEKAKPFLLAKLKSGLPEKDPIAAKDPKQFTEQYFQLLQARAERQTAIVLLGRLNAAETVPFIRSELVKKDLDQYFARACFRAALHLGTDEAVSFVIDCATNPKYRIHHQSARAVLVDFANLKASPVQ